MITYLSKNRDKGIVREFAINVRLFGNMIQGFAFIHKERDLIREEAFFVSTVVNSIVPIRFCANVIQ